MRKLINDDRLNIRISKAKKAKYKEYCELFKKDMSEDILKYVDDCIERLEDFKKSK